jgi:hypothetical protein
VNSRVSLNARMDAAKTLGWSEIPAQQAFRLAVREAYQFGEVKGLIDFLRLCGPKAFLSDKQDPDLQRKLLAHIIDDLAALFEVGVLTFEKRSGRGRPPDPRLERSLARAHIDYKRIQKDGVPVGINSDGSPKLKRLPRAEALKLVVGAWNRDVEERRERHREKGRDPNRRTFIVRVTANQLEKQINGDRPSARRHAKPATRPK